MLICLAGSLGNRVYHKPITLHGMRLACEMLVQASGRTSHPQPHVSKISHDH